MTDAVTWTMEGVLLAVTSIVPPHPKGIWRDWWNRRPWQHKQGCECDDCVNRGFWLDEGESR